MTAQNTMNYTFALSFPTDVCSDFSYDVGVMELGISYVETLVLMSTLIFVTRPKMTKISAIFLPFHYNFSDFLPRHSSQWRIEIEYIIYQNARMDNYFDSSDRSKSPDLNQKSER